MINIDYDELIKTINLLDLYLREENVLFDTIKISFTNLDKDYNGRNNIELSKNTIEISEKLIKIHNTHKDYIMILEREIIKYKEITEKANKELENLS